jgi:uncharacterized membrane protein YozB (DUF420 family)
MLSRILAVLSLALALLAPAAALATVSVGQPAFDFTKNQLVSSATGPAWTLSAHRGQVVVLFVLGWY